MTEEQGLESFETETDKSKRVLKKAGNGYELTVTTDGGETGGVTTQVFKFTREQLEEEKKKINSNIDRLKHNIKVTKEAIAAESCEDTPEIRAFLDLMEKAAKMDNKLKREGDLVSYDKSLEYWQKLVKEIRMVAPELFRGQ